MPTASEASQIEPHAHIFFQFTGAGLTTVEYYKVMIVMRIVSSVGLRQIKRVHKTVFSKRYNYKGCDNENSLLSTVVKCNPTHLIDNLLSGSVKH
jgi:hypothetical protein